jgi:hypothetical protein
MSGKKSPFSSAPIMPIVPIVPPQIDCWCIASYVLYINCSRWYAGKQAFIEELKMKQLFWLKGKAASTGNVDWTRFVYKKPLAKIWQIERMNQEVWSSKQIGSESSSYDLANEWIKRLDHLPGKLDPKPLVKI